MFIELDKYSVIVLFEFLSKIDEEEIENFEILQSEKIVLSNIHFQLEKKLTEPFEDNYLEILKESQDKVEKFQR